MPNPARHRVADMLASLILAQLSPYMDTPTIENGTRKRLAHGLLPWADKIIEEVSSYAEASEDQGEKGDG